MVTFFHSLLWLLIIGLYAPIFYTLYTVRWKLIDYQHAYFVLPAALFLLLLAWKKISLSAQSSRPSGSGWLLLVIAGMALYILGQRQELFVLSTFSLIPLLLGVTAFLYGTAVLKLVWAPIVYLLFLVPPPPEILDALMMILRHGVAMAVSGFLGAMDYPIERQGLMLMIDRQEIFIASTCSGFRSLINFMAVVCLYVSLIRASAATKAILLVSVVPLALFGNFVRVCAVSLITFYLGAKAGHGFLHEVSGVLVFGMMILGFLILDRMLNAWEEE